MCLKTCGPTDMYCAISDAMNVQTVISGQCMWSNTNRGFVGPNLVRTNVVLRLLYLYTMDGSTYEFESDSDPYDDVGIAVYARTVAKLAMASKSCSSSNVPLNEPKPAAVCDGIDEQQGATERDDVPGIDDLDDQIDGYNERETMRDEPVRRKQNMVQPVSRPCDSYRDSFHRASFHTPLAAEMQEADDTSRQDAIRLAYAQRDKRRRCCDIRAGQSTARPRAANMTIVTRREAPYMTRYLENMGLRETRRRVAREHFHTHWGEIPRTPSLDDGNEGDGARATDADDAEVEVEADAGG